ncbi:TAT-variant-translocated molybdopterin oxidoreductase [Cytophagaceae bacterium ABcell3]|nr:TAT-variant-translocated molybdopterin oxidoreductase [Cytophagaceae bacterium ABcell3]
MKDKNKIYWQSIEQLSQDPEFQQDGEREFPESAVPSKGSETEDKGPDRRDFLKVMGFSVAAASLAACDTPVKKIIPYVNKPEEIEPGIANWYASTYLDGSDYCSVLVKTREGRPIKIEGNKLSSVTKGGTSARAQASVLSLYDETRLHFFTVEGQPQRVKNNTEYRSIDNDIIAGLNNAQNAGKGIRIVSSTIMSPSTKAVINDFISRYPNAQHVQYDAVSASGILAANEASFGRRVIPSYDFSKANVIVSFGADFLGTWISPIEYAKQYASTRKLSKDKKSMSRHYQFETTLTVTGSNADYRQPVRPSQEGLFVAALYNKLASNRINVPAVESDLVDQAAQDLLANRGKSLVVSGSNDAAVQTLVNEINNILGNYGTSIDINTPSNQKQGNDAAMANFISDVEGGNIGAVIFYNANPVYDHPKGQALANSLENVDLKISFSERADETAALCNYVCPDRHFLESWNDAEPKQGFYSLGQPTISPLFKGTRQAQDSLLIWAGRNVDYYTYIQNHWRNNIFEGGNFQSQWDKALHDGIYEVAQDGGETPSINTDLSGVQQAIRNNYSAEPQGLEISFYETVSVGNGKFANNPWLQELPDPLSKVTWDNYLAIPMSIANEQGLKQGDLVNLTVDGNRLNKAIPVLVQPGQANGTVSVALGYGRVRSGSVGDEIGVDAYPLLSVTSDTVAYTGLNVTFEKTGESQKLAQTQTALTSMARPVVQEATLSEYQSDPYAGRFKPMIHTSEGHRKPMDVTLWYEHEMPNHLWGMSIDLNSCIGCNACIIACNAENNIPVVGKTEVLNRREMHWLRIDRYYSSPAETGKYFDGDQVALENPAENPRVTFQPMLCQHCNHAPCETVCPVAATTHSSDGLNQMAYNRCIGTRYCANNCPYKVRRFNWFKYYNNPGHFDKNTPMNTALGRMVLNPDVTVRSRGVMEKCSMCVQRIQEGRLHAKRERRRPVDGEIVTACAGACPTDAIVFGDLNDKESQVYKTIAEQNKERSFTVLEEINVRPNIAYLTKIRNINKA